MTWKSTWDVCVGEYVFDNLCHCLSLPVTIWGACSLKESIWFHHLDTHIFTHTKTGSVFYWVSERTPRRLSVIRACSYVTHVHIHTHAHNTETYKDSSTILRIQSLSLSLTLSLTCRPVTLCFSLPFFLLCSPTRGMKEEYICSISKSATSSTW